jgi:hypothetical protein
MQMLSWLIKNAQTAGTTEKKNVKGEDIEKSLEM